MEYKGQVKQDAEWIDKAKEKMPSEKQNTVKITKNDVKRKLKSMSDWKGIKDFFKVLNKCIDVGNVPGWLVEGRTILVIKDSKKGTEVGNYRPIAYFNLIWKLLQESLVKRHDYLEENKLLPEEQKGRRMCQGTKDKRAIDRCILQNLRQI